MHIERVTDPKPPATALSAEQTESVRPTRNPLVVASAMQLGVIPAERLARELEEHGAEFFDLSDPLCPIAIRRCRSCKVELRFEFPEGIRPALLRYIGDVACERCAELERAAEERGKGAAGVRKRLEESGIPSELAKEATWESLISRADSPDDTKRREEAIQAAKDWAAEERPSKGLLLWGPPGAGKTRLAATAAVERMKHSAITWVSVGVLMAQLDGAWNDEERKAALKVLTSPGPVVMDDIDKIVPNGRMRGQIFTALDKREQSRSPLIVTANGSIADLEKMLGEAVSSRLTGMCRVLRYPGADLRLELT